jgi:hypothetical protein
MFINPEGIPPETCEQIEERISERFEVLEILVNASLNGEARGLIVSGPPGLGKSYKVEEMLREWDQDEVNHTIVKGFVRATGLYKLFYAYRELGKVIVFDDADSIFFDDVSLNLLKAVCDTTDRRRVGWMTEAKFFDEETGEQLPKHFEFEGTIIFITNLDFDNLIIRGHKLAPHLSALISRAHYIDLAMKTKQDYFIRIQQVIMDGLLDEMDLTSEQQGEVLAFIEINLYNLRELSLRSALKIGALRKSSPNNWERIALVTCCKNVK